MSAPGRLWGSHANLPAMRLALAAWVVAIHEAERVLATWGGISASSRSAAKSLSIWSRHRGAGGSRPVVHGPVHLKRGLLGQAPLRCACNIGLFVRFGRHPHHRSTHHHAIPPAVEQTHNTVFPSYPSPPRALGRGPKAAPAHRPGCRPSHARAGAAPARAPCPPCGPTGRDPSRALRSWGPHGGRSAAREGLGGAGAPPPSLQESRGVVAPLGGPGGGHPERRQLESRPPPLPIAGPGSLRRYGAPAA